MPELPTGTVTLLFTDIEGSTLLLQKLGERYADMLTTCRQLLRTAFQHWNGVEVDTQGDAFFVVFARASDAISAVIDMQRAMASHGWPNGAAVALRIGLHTGEPTRTAEGYIGLDVHHAARIMSVGHGGQVLLSQTTRELVKHTLPEGVSLRDLGEHRLKDLQLPGHLYQLIIADLYADFPPLKTLENSPNNLPIQPTSLIGREKEVAALLNLLRREEVRLLTLTGPGGTGKTRLGLQVAAELIDIFPDGVYYVNLAPLSDPALVLPTLAQTLDIKEISELPLLELLKSSLHLKHLLLLLDNFEQVVGAAGYVADLLAVCPNLKVMVTSRMTLHIRGEQEYAVPPLAVPDPKHLPDLMTLSQYEAVALFIQRAQAVKPEFQVTNANAPAVAEICVRLDGLPLAIELAAARIKVLPPQALLARLGQRLTVLTSGARDVPARQQTLRNTIKWSYDLLDAQEQRLFRWISVFVGGCTLEAIEVICATLSDGVNQVLDGVASLIDNSLLQQVEQEGNEPRLMMLETIREYGLECLNASGEVEVNRQAYAAYYLALAEKAELELRGPQQVKWLERFEWEYDNLRSALSWLLERKEDRESIEIALRLCVALVGFWIIRGYASEGRNFLERALRRSEEVRVSVRAKALNAAGDLALNQYDNERAEVLCRESLMLYRELGDKSGIGTSLGMLGRVARRRGNYAAALTALEEGLGLFREVGDKGNIADLLTFLAAVVSLQSDYARAYALAEESLALFRELGNKGSIALALLNLASVASYQGEYARTYSLAEESLALFRELGDKNGIASAYHVLGEIALNQGNYTVARPLLEESLAIYKELGMEEGSPVSLYTLARVAFGQGDYDAARALHEESLKLFLKSDSKLPISLGLEELGAVVAAQGHVVWAARLMGAGSALREAIGSPLEPRDRANYKRMVAATKAQLGEQAFSAAWAEGRGMTPEQALAMQTPKVESISGGTSSTPSAKLPTIYPDGLTARELEVLRLLATGLTDAQIAEQMVLSLHTIHAHLRTIYSKLGVTSRSAATRYAFEHQLV
ncbi:MAG: tetratricopeptide repeat protein [Ktedonobacteraceae bacterium]